jgi:hypothetical protein
MRVIRRSLLSLLLAVGAAGTAAADETRPVLLPVEGDQSIRSLTDELELAFTRQGKKVQVSSLRLEDLMLAVGCKTTSIACLQSIGENVKASGLIISRARKLKEGVELSVRWFDVKTGGDLGDFLRLLPAGPVEREKILDQAVHNLVTPPSTAPASREMTGSLSVSASLPFVEIVLEGQVRGTVPLEFRNLRAGAYTVIARREGYLTVQQTALVKPDQVTHLQFDMTVAPRSASGGSSYFEAIRPATWGVFGGGLLCIAVGAGFAAHLKATQDHLNQAQGITYQEIIQMRDYRDAGQRDALAANILFGLGGAALVASVVLSYFDYRRANQRESSEGRSAATKGAQPLSAVRLGPTSASLHLEF